MGIIQEVQKEDHSCRNENGPGAWQGASFLTCWCTIGEWVLVGIQFLFVLRLFSFFLEFDSYRCWRSASIQHDTIFRFILEMTPFSRDPEPVFALIPAKRQGYSWLLGHIFIHFTSHILLSFVFASVWFNLLSHSLVWHEKFVFSHLFFILFYFSTPYPGINSQYLCNLLSFQY
jgi:hypothetical protein